MPTPGSTHQQRRGGWGRLVTVFLEIWSLLFWMVDPVVSLCYVGGLIYWSSSSFSDQQCSSNFSVVGELVRLRLPGSGVVIQPSLSSSFQIIVACIFWLQSGISRPLHQQCFPGSKRRFLGHCINNVSLAPMVFQRSRGGTEFRRQVQEEDSVDFPKDQCVLISVRMTL